MFEGARGLAGRDAGGAPRHPMGDDVVALAVLTVLDASGRKLGRALTGLTRFHRGPRAGFSKGSREEPMNRWHSMVALGLGVLVATGAVAGPAAAAPVGVSLGEVRAPAGGAIERRFREIVRREFDRLAGVRGSSKTYVVSAALLRIEKSSEPGVRCVVSATLRDRRGGSLEAILRGEASVLGGEGSVAREAEAMRVAVRSALSRLDETLSRLR